MTPPTSLTDNLPHLRSAINQTPPTLNPLPLYRRRLADGTQAERAPAQLHLTSVNTSPDSSSAAAAG